LPRASKLLHLREDQFNGLLDTSIGIFLDFAIGSPAIADRQCKLQFTAPRFLADCFLAPLPEKVQFELAHRPFEP
jgi:hypothetical protein